MTSLKRLLSALKEPVYLRDMWKTCIWCGAMTTASEKVPHASDCNWILLATVLSAMPKTEEALFKFMENAVEQEVSKHRKAKYRDSYDIAPSHLEFLAARLAESGVAVPDEWQFKSECVLKSLNQLRHVQGCTDEQHENLGDAIWNLWQSLGVMEPEGWRDESELSKLVPTPPAKCRWTWVHGEPFGGWVCGGCGTCFALGDSEHPPAWNVCPICSVPIEKVPDEKATDPPNDCPCGCEGDPAAHYDES